MLVSGSVKRVFYVRNENDESVLTFGGEVERQYEGEEYIETEGSV